MIDLKNDEVEWVICCTYDDIQKLLHYAIGGSDTDCDYYFMNNRIYDFKQQILAQKFELEDLNE